MGTSTQQEHVVRDEEREDDGWAEGFVQLHLTGPELLRGQLGPAAAGALERAGVVGGQPFILGADGSYDPELNGSFGNCPAGAKLRREHAAEIRELNATIAVYTNQI